MVGVEAQHEAEPARDADAGDALAAVPDPPGEPKRRVWPGLVDGLEGGHLDRLLLGDLEGVPVADERHRRRDDEAGDEGRLHGLAGEVEVASLEQVPRGDARHDEAAGDEGARHGVGVARRGRGVERRGPEVGEYGFAVLDLVAARRLLPGVRDQDPEGRQPRAGHDEPAGGVVEASRDALASEKKDTEEGRLEEEGEQSLGRQWGAEDVSHEARVLGPVGAEGELHGDPGGDADGERRREQLDPEVGRRPVGRDAALVVAPFRQHHHERQTDAERDEDEVESDGEGELDAGQRQGVHAVLAPPRRRGPSPLVSTGRTVSFPGPDRLTPLFL